MLRWRLILVTTSREFPLRPVHLLWLKDSTRSPFASPHYLKEMADMALSQGDRVILSVLTGADGAFRALWPMRLDPQGTLSFLPFLYADQRSCLREPDVPDALLSEGVSRILDEFRPRRVDLELVSDWNHSKQALETGLERSGYRRVSYPQGLCPLATYEGFKRGKKNLFFPRKRIEEKIRSLERKKGLHLEVLPCPDSQALQEWLNDFFALHVERWAGTATESRFRSKQERVRFIRVLGAWSQDGILFPFTLRVADTPKAFNVMLAAGKRMVFSHHAADARSKDSPGTLLFIMVGRWMLDHGFTIHDFGLGDEPYKARLCDAMETVWRIYATRTPWDAGYLRHCLEQSVRRHPKFLQLAKKAKKRLRSLKTRQQQGHQAARKRWR
ncbi:MAG: Protein involved in cellulose biosynthesis (CelD)-like protein [Desulfacinum sp.]|jgi:CelD/BcsL family acetyltransferase involved in cellulose biosynthesis|nr:Protein involved in cellulose biosynthesis (CelD)-like protein [Desulfacinum sp.]